MSRPAVLNSTVPPMGSGDRRTMAVTCGVLFALTCVVYGLFLQRVPPYLSHDEIVFSLNAHSIATTGRDANGRLFPLFFEINSQFWATPVVIYTTAVMLKVAQLPVWPVKNRVTPLPVMTALPDALNELPAITWRPGWKVSVPPDTSMSPQ